MQDPQTPVANDSSLQATAIAASHLRYEYLLVVGPGRSGSEFLYENLKSHPHLAFPEIKEGYYYRSPSRFKKVRSQLKGGHEKIIVDIANLGFHDSSLPKGMQTLQDDGYRILLVLLLRDHQDRAVSVMRFRKSRGEFSALFGMRRLEQAAVGARLTPQNLTTIYGLDVDVLTIYFPTLVQHTVLVLDILSSLCGIAKFNTVQQQTVNESVQARNLVFSACGKFMAVALRGLGCRPLLQRFKDNDFLRKLFFRPLSGNEETLHLSEESRQILKTAYCECCSIIENAAEQIEKGIYLRKAGSSGP